LDAVFKLSASTDRVFPKAFIAVPLNNLEIAWVLIQYQCFQSFDAASALEIPESHCQFADPWFPFTLYED